MSWALWEKSLREAKWLLVGCAALMFAFHLIRVWVTSHFTMGDVRQLLEFAPDFVKGFFAVPPEVIAAPAGRLAIGYDDPLVVVIMSCWAIARGSDSVSGEIGRGTMEVLLAQPVRRIDVLLSSAVVNLLGAATLATLAWLGTYVGLAFFTLDEPVSARILLPAALNLFGLGAFLGGLATMLSSCDRYRTRTIGIVVSFYVVQTLMKIVGIAVPDFSWLKKYTFLTVFEPQQLAYHFWPEILAAEPEQSWRLLIDYNGLLIGLGLVAYAIAALVFTRRDLPAPL
ncbi:MAG: ABC transporter permease subunit [Planctomycetales bacterium]|nr:ABC transporter permease subunit [Planctomycetales bacterium]